MELILRAFFIYLFILLIFRMAGKRTLSQLTTFDFILLLVVGEATQQALLNDGSITEALLLIGTLVTLDVIFAFFSERWPLFDKIANGVPLIILKNGNPLIERMEKENIEMGDILEAARKKQGLESIEQIKYAVLEKDGKISIIPKGKE
ncbi:MAG TPA: YetF domain-containing protein [Balneolaceae bacterium]